MVTGVWLGNDDATSTTLSGGNVPAAIWSEFMTKAHEGKQVADIPGGSYDGQLVAQPVIDPATGQAVIDPATGQPMTQYVDAGSGEQVQTTVDAATGQLMQYDPATGQYVPATAMASAPAPSGQVDPATGMPMNNATSGGYLVDANGNQIDPATGQVVGQVVGGNQVIQPQPVDPSMGQAPIDANTGLPMTLVTDPATGQQVWVPSAPAQAQQQQPFQQEQQWAPPAPLGEPVPIQNERSQRTLMDMIFGDEQN
jgi:penicillin-binding protein 1A